MMLSIEENWRIEEAHPSWLHTTDNGIEFFNHDWIAQKLNTKVYFADPIVLSKRGY